MKVNNTYLGYFHTGLLIMLFFFSLASIFQLVTIHLPILFNQDKIIKEEFRIEHIEKYHKSSNHRGTKYSIVASGYLLHEPQMISINHSNFFKLAPEGTYKKFNEEDIGESYDVWFLKESNLIVGRFSENFPIQTYWSQTLLFLCILAVFFVVLILFIQRYKTYTF